MKRSTTMILFSGLLGLWLACGGKTVDESKYVAQVGNEVLMVEDLKNQIPESMRESITIDQVNNMIQHWINLQLVYQQAHRIGLHNTLSKELQQELKQFEMQYLANKLVEREITRKIQVSEAESQAYYEKNKVQFIRTAAEIRLIHFLTTSAEVSVRIVQALNSGKTLEQLVLQYKSEKNIWPNGDLGYFPEVSLPPEIGRVVSRIRKDETSRDIKTEMGFHFIKVLDRQPAGSTKSIEEVRDQIAETLKAEKRNEAYTAFLAKLRSKAESEKFFQINYDALKVFQHDTTNILIQ